MMMRNLALVEYQPNGFPVEWRGEVETDRDGEFDVVLTDYFSGFRDIDATVLVVNAEPAEWKFSWAGNDSYRAIHPAAKAFEDRDETFVVWQQMYVR